MSTTIVKLILNEMLTPVCDSVTHYVMKHDNANLLRFLSKVDIGDKRQCWPWKAGTNRKGKFGYGQIRVGGKCIGAHRFSYEAFNGEVPEGLFVLHKCDNPVCVNPGHLFLGTAKDNAQDCIAKRRQGMRGAKRRSQKGLVTGSEKIICDLSFTLGSQKILGEEIKKLTGQKVTSSMISNWKDGGVSWRFRPAVAKIAADKGIELPDDWLFVDNAS